MEEVDYERLKSRIADCESRIEKEKIWKKSTMTN